MPGSAAYLRMSSVIIIEQKCGPHMEQKCAVLAPSCGRFWRVRVPHGLGLSAYRSAKSFSPLPKRLESKRAALVEKLWLEMRLASREQLPNLGFGFIQFRVLHLAGSVEDHRLPDREQAIRTDEAVQSGTAFARLQVCLRKRQDDNLADYRLAA